MPGYSSAPLVRKLGIAPGGRVRFVDAPPGFRGLLGPLPVGAREMAASARDLDLAIIFVTRSAALATKLEQLLPCLAQDGQLWVSWPKKSSGRVTDLGENAVRIAGLAAGWVDVKVCAIDAVWSALKFVRRLKDRE